MGHSSRKKKKRGAAGRKATKDHAAQLEGDQTALDEELTALTSIFREDFKVTSESPQTRFSICIRPYSDSTGFEDLNVSAILDVICFPGYPHKCPKLRIIPEQNLSKEDADRLLSLLVDQANIYSREGRVMIFDLFEAAQEFVSEIAPAHVSVRTVPRLGLNTIHQTTDEDVKLNLDSDPYPGISYIYNSFDLYSQLYDDSSWSGPGSDLATDNGRKNTGSQVKPNVRSKRKTIVEKSHASADKVNIAKGSSEDKAEQQNVTKHGFIRETAPNLHVVAEETETETDSKILSVSNAGNTSDTPERSFSSLHEPEESDLADEAWNEEDCNSDFGSSNAPSYVSDLLDDALRNKKKDLILVHLLRMACASKDSLSAALPAISSELYNIGVLSEWANDLISESPSVFGETFGHVFGQQMTSSKCSLFWRADNSSSRPNSRYLNDFEELHSIGQGGFGRVALCKNKLDGRQYAVKKIRLKDRSPQVNEKILREVATLSRLQHQHVVRYYQAWVETEYGHHHVLNAGGSRTAESSIFSYDDISLSDAGGGNKQESTYLYIQMEYCPRTLRHDFETYSSSFDVDHAWHLFRQIVEGLAHVHSQGIIHRDLTPSNIFFDVRNDIKIGDFGLAKFLKLEQLDLDQYLPTEAIGVSMDGTGQVGTYFYTAPEVEQKWPQINEKVDMYSLGVIFFELWHPFATAMERHLVLSDLKQKGDPPMSWAAQFPGQSNMLRRLLSPSPSDRPSAVEVLQNELPPRMEDEWLNDVLRMIQTPEDTYVYDRVISTVFNEDRLIAKMQCQHESSKKFTGNNDNSELLDTIIEVAKEVFKRHCAKRFQISPLHTLEGNFTKNRRKTVKILTQGGEMLELCYELRTPFVVSIAANQTSSFKRYEISWVHRRAVGHSTPYRFLQGDFDIIGGASPIPEAEIVKVTLDLGTRFYDSKALVVRLNHSKLAEAVCSWAGVSQERRQNVAEFLSSTLVQYWPNKADRKSQWSLIRGQLLQDLRLSEEVVEKLHKADQRFCGPADQVLARLRGTLFHDKSACKALDDLSAFLKCLRVWSVQEHITIDVLMPPSECYYTDLFFQVYSKEGNQGSSSHEKLLAVGGRYDCLVEQAWDKAYKSKPPGAVGVSIALEKFLPNNPSSDLGLPRLLSRIEPSISVLVCSRGGGGLLNERMELVAELWKANIKAQFVPQEDPSLQEQYEYASDHDIKCLVFITEAGLSQTDLVKVRHLDAKREKEVKREELVKFLSDAICLQFKNPTIWS
ncbi:eIF-2-alpha kinase GCN2 [Phragmites australis]|uniref:eIF-2-alpha kinase GCN2 n=1 Tax=Phragmites australis TaxID=29695 RepID=UPI002D7941F7|nr:eIF-2-alpha kinase GCN2 [Phragmites australis]XP_062226037.1 eIF-2-alpha kinase GCN2 [Phragmites australis]